jgi:rhodanese-related sulfurtransferase/CBS domain-containing protein
MPERIEVERLQELIAGGAQLVEVLPAEEYAEEHLPGATNIPLKTLDGDSTRQLDKTMPVIVYCWDYFWDLSPRAACRLEALGFEQVFDYVPGKADWLARGLPREGQKATEKRVGDLVRTDAVTARLDDRVGDIRERVEASPYGFGFVVADRGTLLGRLRRSALEGNPNETAADVMEPGPSTVRADTPPPELASRLDKGGLTTAVVTTPEGRLMGVVRRADLG